MSSIDRESLPFYIGSTKKEQESMLTSTGLKSKNELFSHIPNEHKFDNFSLLDHLSHNEIKKELQLIASQNKLPLAFISDALPVRAQNSLTQRVCSIRGLTTAYTPYQPERSQGTLESLWLYQSLLSELTGFEAINASLYERSTALYESIQCAIRIQRIPRVLVSKTLYPQDLEVLETLIAHTKTSIDYIDFDKETGLIDEESLSKKIKENSYAAFVFPQVNQFGLIENVDKLTNLSHQANLKVIAQIDPLLIGPKSLKPPSEYGNKGADIFIAEAQHLALGANLGGPGLGVFGIRFNQEDKKSIRQSPGRFIGRTVDKNGKNAKCIVLSTREQHIRRSKATSNICSNQSFVATLAAANLLQLGSRGVSEYFNDLHLKTITLVKSLLEFSGVELTFPKTPFVHEIILNFSHNLKDLITNAQEQNLFIGLDMASRLKEGSLKISLIEEHSIKDIETLIDFFSQYLKKETKKISLPEISMNSLRLSECAFPSFSDDEIVDHFEKLGNQNLSPDDGPYPLGSCTMKYNPHINDWAAGLNSFVQAHPQLPESFIQGSLHILYETQEYFKAITGLPAVTTQPVAGAQGELVGIKLFQAYHKDNSKSPRDTLLIPKSAHGTNPATASVAGFENIIELDATPTGEIDLDHLEQILQHYDNRVAGIMITNPNTSGVYESNFKKISEKIHNIGGLVYMDGANMNAIAGHIDLSEIGVDAVHNNLHKTWSIPHGGGGPGDAIVAVSNKLIDYLPGKQIIKDGKYYKSIKPSKSIGSFHRHWGNFAHKVRCFTYLKALGTEGVKSMSSNANLSSRYLFTKLKDHFPTLPLDREAKRMHEFIVTLSDDLFDKLQSLGITKAQIIPLIGKLFLDFGLHSPTVAFPEVFGLMIEPTESFSKKELDRFADVLISIKKLVTNHPEVLLTTPHFTPVQKVDEVKANKSLILFEKIRSLNEPYLDKFPYQKLWEMNTDQIYNLILKTHQEIISHNTTETRV